MPTSNVVVCDAVCALAGIRTLPVVLKVLYDFVHNLDVRMSLALRLSDLLRVAAALGDEVVTVYPSMSVMPLLCLSNSSLSKAIVCEKKSGITHTSNMV